MTLDDLLVATVGARLRLVILDACRNDPLARSMRRTVATRRVSGGSFGQLDGVLLGDETLVAYAAAAGTTAAVVGGFDHLGACSRTTTARLRPVIPYGLICVATQLLSLSHSSSSAQWVLPPRQPQYYRLS